MHGADTRVRRRQPDVWRLLPVIRDLSGLKLDDVGGDEIAEAKKKQMIDLPVPEVSQVPDYASFTPATFKAPDGYIKRAPARDADIISNPQVVEYDLEADDENWLACNPRIGGAAADPRSRLSSVTFERLLDLCEHLSGMQESPLSLPDAQGHLPAILRDNNAAWAQTQAAKGTAPASSSSSGGERFPLPPSCASSAGALARLIEEVHKYWGDKRARRRNKPLLRRYWAITTSNDQNPHHTFRPHDKEKRQTRARTRKNDSETGHRLLSLRQNLHAALGLAEYTLQRERVKRDTVAVAADLFAGRLHELTDTSGAPWKPSCLHLDDGPKLKLQRSKAAASGMAPAGGEGGGGGEYLGGGGDGRSMLGGAGGGLMRRPLNKGPPGARAPGGGAGAGQKVTRPGGGLPGAGVGGVVGPKAGGPKSAKPGAPGGPPGGGPGGAAQAGGAAAGGAGSGMWRGDTNLHNAGLRIDHGQLAFTAGYGGFRLGPYAAPRTVPDHYAQQRYFEPSHGLALDEALGLRPNGLLVNPCNVACSLRNVMFPVLPSRGGVFPMDAGYPGPGSVGEELYRADLTLQHDMVVAKGWWGRMPTRQAWETEGGGGLAPGIGAGLRPDGRGWESHQARLEARLTPHDNVRGSLPRRSARQEEEEEEEEGGEGGRPPLAAHLHECPPASGCVDAEGRVVLCGRAPRLPSAALAPVTPDGSDSEEEEEGEEDDVWMMLGALTQSVSAMDGTPQRSARKRRRGEGGGEGDAFSARQFTLRPRVGRGGRLALDRVDLASSSVPGLALHVGASQQALQERARERARDVARAWRLLGVTLQTEEGEGAQGEGVHIALRDASGASARLSLDPADVLAKGGAPAIAASLAALAQHLAAIDNGSGEGAEVSASAPAGSGPAPLLVGLRSSDMPLPSPVALMRMHGFTGHPGDPHALHLSVFAHFASTAHGLAGPSARVDSSEDVHGSLLQPLGTTGWPEVGPCTRDSDRLALRRSGKGSAVVRQGAFLGAATGARVAGISGLSSHHLSSSRFARVGVTPLNEDGTEHSTDGAKIDSAADPASAAREYLAQAGLAVGVACAGELDDLLDAAMPGLKAAAAKVPASLDSSGKDGRVIVPLLAATPFGYRARAPQNAVRACLADVFNPSLAAGGSNLPVNVAAEHVTLAAGAIGGHGINVLSNYVHAALVDRKPVGGTSGTVALSTSGQPILSMLVTDEQGTASALGAAPAMLSRSAVAAASLTLDGFKVGDWNGAVDSDEEDVRSAIVASVATRKRRLALEEPKTDELVGSAFEDQQFLFAADAVPLEVVEA